MSYYPPPVDRLLKVGEPADAWPDYPGLYGLGQEHVSDLIRMTQDRELHDAGDDDLLVWGAHACLARAGATPRGGSRRSVTRGIATR